MGRMSPIARAMREYVQRDLAGGTDSPSLAAIVEMGPVPAYSRRDVLKMVGTVGLASALTACTGSSSKTPSSVSPVSSPTEHDARVVVVGAGLAGTTAAFRLAQQGVSVQLFEARDRVGGRCWTARGFSDGQTAEHGGEFIDSRHVHLRGLTKELGLPLDDLWEGWVQGSIWPDWIGGRVMDHGEIQVHLDRISKAVTEQAHRIGLFDSGKPNSDAYSYGTATPAAAELDRFTMEDWLEQHVPGIPEDVVGFLNESMAAWYGLDMPDLSAVNWIDYFVIPYRGADERWRVRGGNDQLPTMVAEKLPPGTLHLEASLESMARRADGTYELRFSDSSDAVVADFVILTNPWTTLRRVDLEGARFDSYRMEAIRNLGMGTDVKLLLQYTMRPQAFKVGDRVWSGGMEHTDPNFETWESSTNEQGSSGLITVYAGGSGSQVFENDEQHVAAPRALVDTILGRIDDVVPGSKDHFNGTAWLDYWTGDPWTLGSYTAYLPGQMTKYWGYAAIPKDNVHFAGEHTSTYSQGFLNGGVESGQRAAIEVMKAIGVPVPDSIGSLPYTKVPLAG